MRWCFRNHAGRAADRAHLRDKRVPVIAFGTGTSLEGISTPRSPGVSIDVRDMNKVLAVHAEDLDCVIEPGSRARALNEHLRDQGLSFRSIPAPTPPLGGMAATRCSAPMRAYGTMKGNVLAMKVGWPMAS